MIGASPGAIGTAVAQQGLRSILSFLNAPQMNMPEAYISARPGLITPEGEVTDAGTEDFLRAYMVAFYEYIERVLTVVPGALSAPRPLRARLIRRWRRHARAGAAGCSLRLRDSRTASITEPSAIRAMSTNATR